MTTRSSEGADTPTAYRISELAEAAGVTSSVIKGLVTQGAVVEIEKQTPAKTNRDANGGGGQAIV